VAPRDFEKPRSATAPPRKAREPKEPLPWQLGHTENEDIFAVQAVVKGIANAAQQQRYHDYVVKTLCRTDRMEFWPGNSEASVFSAGKRWVGLMLRRIERLRPDHRDKMPEGASEPIPQK
jgi:hypothetical protein